MLRPAGAGRRVTAVEREAVPGGRAGLIADQGYSFDTGPTVFTMVPLLRACYGLRAASRLSLAADTASITIMEIVDNLVMIAIPGAMDAPLDSALFWGSLAGALAIAGVAAFPVNRWLIARGRGHAVVHGHH